MQAVFLNEVEYAMIMERFHRWMHLQVCSGELSSKTLISERSSLEQLSIIWKTFFVKSSHYVLMWRRDFPIQKNSFNK